jgi:hypothetical protein
MLNIIKKIVRSGAPESKPTNASAVKVKDVSFSDVDHSEMEIIASVGMFTMSSIERRLNVVDSLKYVLRHDLAGDIVECGVWRGGMMMLAMKFLLQSGASNRTFWLYDTFEGMPDPTDVDVDVDGKPATDRLALDESLKDQSHVWAIAGIEEVRMNLETTGYPISNIKLIKGRVEETIPATLPKKIAILRLDTDWYESTKHELEHFYDRVVPGGVVIIDDYGYWSGARKAVDEFLEKRGERILLHRIDHTGRSFVKP